MGAKGFVGSGKIIYRENRFSEIKSDSFQDIYKMLKNRTDENKTILVYHTDWYLAEIERISYPGIKMYEIELAGGIILPECTRDQVHLTSNDVFKLTTQLHPQIDSLIMDRSWNNAKSSPTPIVINQITCTRTLEPTDFIYNVKLAKDHDTAKCVYALECGVLTKCRV